MPKLMNEKVMEYGYDGLIVDNAPPADVFSVKLAAGAVAMKRGTLLGLNAAGEMAIMGTTDHVANCILTDDIAAGETATLAYRTGHFNRQALICKDGYTLKAEDEEELRKGGILLSDAISY